MVAANDLDIIRKIDDVLHEPSRLSIIFALRKREALSFGELKSILGMTDGNLSIHLRTLEKSNYITTSRTRSQGKPRKLCRLSGDGQVALDRYLQVLQQLVKAGKVKKR